MADWLYFVPIVVPTVGVTVAEKGVRGTAEVAGPMLAITPVAATLMPTRRRTAP